MSSTATQLAPAETSRLQELERVIEQGLRTFVEVGEALLEIRGARLYRATHATFEDYCRSRWGFSRVHAHRLIEASQIITVLPTGNTPPSERVARELAPLKHDEKEVLGVWQEAQAEAAELGTRLTAQTVKRHVRKRLARMKRERDIERLRTLPLPPPPSDGARIECCDIRDLDVEPGSVDLIFTDPPYLANTLDRYDWLADFAAAALKPGAMLVAYSGNVHALDCAKRLERTLRFVCFGGVYMPGAHNQVHKFRMRAVLKPLLFFSNGEFRPREWWAPMLTSPKPEKDLHAWQQSEGDSGALIEALTPLGGLVCDPFVGSGTTAVVALGLGRRFVGCDVDPVAVRTARERLAATTKELAA